MFALAFALLFCLPQVDSSTPRPGSPGVGDEYYPGAGNGGYDVLHYDISLDVEMEKGAVEATVLLDATATHSLSSFNLDLVGLEVESVQVGEKQATFSRDGQELTITPSEPIEAGSRFSVSIEYSGIPGPTPDPAVQAIGLPGTGWYKTNSGIYVISECVGASGWLPCNDHPSDKATFTFRVTVPTGYVVAANGLLITESEEGASRTFVWKASDPMATYLATIDIAPFEVRIEEGPGGIPLRLYHPIGASKRELAAFDRTKEMLNFFSERFGPYPFEAFGGVVSYEMIGGALETQTIPVYSRYVGEQTVVHEVAHMWFGDCVGVEQWKDMWLNEGFAVYAEWMWRERDDGPAALGNAVKLTYRRVRRGGTGPPVSPGTRGLFGQSTYGRGPLVLHALRTKVGDETFFKILRAWVEENFNDTATTDDFVELCNRVHGEDLSPLFAAWLYGERVPEVPEYMSPRERRKYEKEREASLHFTEDSASGALHLLDGETPVFSYRYGDQLPEGVPADRLRSSYLHPIHGLDGEVLTDDFPADHYHHRGLSLMWPRMKVGETALELWHIKGVRQIFDRWVERRADRNGATLIVENDWLLTDGSKAARERISYRVHPANDVGRAIDVEYRITVADQPITLQGAAEKGYGGFNLRFAPREETVLTTEAGLEGKDSDRVPHSWADLSARFAGRETPSGIAILVDSSHPAFPPPWTLRHYGILNVAWPGVESRTLSPGEVVTMRYRLWVHRGGATGGGVAEAWTEFTSG
jgi:hypothetical protein